MAKLSANGEVLATVTKDLQLSEGTVCTQQQVLMSNGRILDKDTYKRADGSKNYGTWKRAGKTSMPREAWIAFKKSNGWFQI